MPTLKGHIAAQIARDAATNSAKDPLYLVCSSMMCWDAAIECQTRAGVNVARPVKTADHDHVISLDDVAVTGSQEMRRVPQGASLGFFRNGTLVHFMIATGAGLAAGNKNLCIGLGNPVGWEILNLAQDLNWQGDGFDDNGTRYLVRYRSIS